MASYLKFNGDLDIARGQTLWTPVSGEATVVMTCFARFLTWPSVSAPVFATEYGALATGIFAHHAAATTSVAAISARYVINIAGTKLGFTLVANGADGAGAPFRLGRVYKLALAVGTNAAGSLTDARLYVDGVQVGAGTQGFPMWDNGGSTVITIGGLGASEGTTPTRAAHMEVYQAMLEVDRPLSEIFTQSDSDPFTDLVLDGDADPALSSLWLMNEGSGTTVVDDNGVADLSIAVNPPQWAPAAEPSFPSPGIARWAFESVEGLALRESDAPTVTPAPVYGPEGPVGGDNTSGRIRLAPRGGWHWDDCHVEVGFWQPGTEFAPSADHAFSGSKTLRSDGPATVTNYSFVSAWSGGFSTGKWWGRFWWYDPGGTSATRLQRIGFGTSGAALRVVVGVQGPQSTTEYMTFVSGATTPAISSGVPISQGWHEFLIYAEADVAGTDTVRIYIDGALVRTETSAPLTQADFERVVVRQDGESATSDDAYWGQIEGGREGGGSHADQTKLVESSGSLVLTVAQPAEGVKFFRSGAVTEEHAGSSSMEVGGAPSVTFRHSTNGGSSWSSPAAFTDANLRALACFGNGQDVLEVTPALTSGLDDMGSPDLSQIDLGYEPNTDLVFADEAAYQEAA